MRITSQMLNDSARKAGLPVNSVSLLNYINKGNSQNILLSALNKKKVDVADSVKKTDYEKLDKEAMKLEQAAENFLQEGEDNIFAQAKSSGSCEEIYKGVESLLDSYNSTLKTLRDFPNTMNNFYCQMLADVVDANRESLESVGITFKKDKTVDINEEKLKAADIASLEKVFGTDSDFSKKIVFLADKISDNAQANVESLSSQYDASGKSYYSSANKYDVCR